MNLELTVLDYDMLGGSDAIGKVTLGKNRKKLEKKHWVEMVENPRRPIIHWHQLKVLGISISILFTNLVFLRTLNQETMRRRRRRRRKTPKYLLRSQVRTSELGVGRAGKGNIFKNIWMLKYFT